MDDIKKILVYIQPLNAVDDDLKYESRKQDRENLKGVLNGSSISMGFSLVQREDKQSKLSDNTLTIVDDASGKVIGLVLKIPESDRNPNFDNEEKPLESSDVDSSYKTFITWGFIEDYLLKWSGIGDGESTIRSTHSNQGGIEVSNQMLLDTFTTSCDYDICILPGNNVDNVPIELSESTKKFLNREAGYYFDIYGDYNQNPLGSDLNRINGEPGELKEPRGYIRNMLVNASYVERIYNTTNGKGTLGNFVTELLKGINISCGSLWNFSLVSKVDDTEKISVIDQRTVDSEVLKQERRYEFKRSFLKSFSLGSNLSNNLSSAAYISSLSGDGYERDGGSVYNFYGYNNGKTIVDGVAREQKAAENTTGDIKKQEVSEGDKPDPYLDYINKSVVYLNTGVGKEQAISANQTWVNSLLSNTSALQYKPMTGLIVSITTPGISGLFSGNGFTLEPVSRGGWLPDRYRDSMIFQMSEISHKIDSTQWETTISSILRHDVNVDIQFNTNDQIYGQENLNGQQ